MSSRKKIFVALLNEGTSVWRPTFGELVGERTYRPLGIVPSQEEWQFQPGQFVVCESQSLPDGKVELVAIRLITNHFE